jgi:flagellar basal body P-ring formation protein FlgA
VGRESVGTWQVPAQAKVMREVLVAREDLKRGQAFTENDAAMEQRDVLSSRDTLAEMPKTAATLELAENVSAGMPLTSRALKLRSVVHRGRTVDALLQDGTMSIVVKAEALEDGAPGQIIKLRNLNSKREFRGKVQNEDTIQVAL